MQIHFTVQFKCMKVQSFARKISIKERWFSLSNKQHLVSHMLTASCLCHRFVHKTGSRTFWICPSQSGCHWPPLPCITQWCWRTKRLFTFHNVVWSVPSCQAYTGLPKTVLREVGQPICHSRERKRGREKGVRGIGGGSETRSGNMIPKSLCAVRSSTLREHS